MREPLLIEPNLTVELIELIPPVHQRVYRIGLEHVGIGVGDAAKFQRRPTKTRASFIATPQQIAIAERWIESFETGARATGLTGLLDRPITLADVKRWSSESVGSIAFTDPVIGLGPSLDELWANLSLRYLGRVRATVPPPSKRISARSERSSIVRAFVARCRSVPALKKSVHRSQNVQGARLPHKLDVTIQNGRLLAVAEALPFGHGSMTEIGERRAILFEAALDLPESVLKLAIFDGAPAGKELLDQTRDFIAAHLGGAVQLKERSAFPCVLEA